MTNTMNGAERDVAASLHQLLLATDGLDSFLEQLAVLAADAVDGDTGCGINLIGDNRATTVCSSDDRAVKLDEIQYADGDGPCLQSARTAEVVLVEDMSSDRRWPAYRDQAVGLGVNVSLSLPLELSGDVAGALNFYVFEPHVFTDDERAQLSQFRDQASRAINLAVRHDELTRQTDHLHAAMGTRRVIDQALGIIMAQNRCNSDEAFAILRRASNNRNVKIQQLAEDMIRTMTGSEPSTDTHWKGRVRPNRPARGSARSS